MLDQSHDYISDAFFTGVCSCVCYTEQHQRLNCYSRTLSCMMGCDHIGGIVTVTIHSCAKCFVTCGCPHPLLSPWQTLMDRLVLGILQGHQLSTFVIHVSALHSICTCFPAAKGKHTCGFREQWYMSIMSFNCVCHGFKFLVYFLCCGQCVVLWLCG